METLTGYPPRGRVHRGALDDQGRSSRLNANVNAKTAGLRRRGMDVLALVMGGANGGEADRS